MLYNTYYLAQIHQILHNSTKMFQQTIQETEYSQLLFINKYNLYIKKFVVSSFRFLPEPRGQQLSSQWRHLNKKRHRGAWKREIQIRQCQQTEIGSIVASDKKLRVRCQQVSETHTLTFTVNWISRITRSYFPHLSGRESTYKREAQFQFT